METILAYAVLTFCGLIVMLIKLPRRFMLRVLGYEYIVDAFFFLVVKWLFFGTQGGMMIAFVSGLLFSLSLHFVTLLVGSERYSRVYCDSCQCHSRRWIYYPPRLQLFRRATQGQHA